MSDKVFSHEVRTGACLFKQLESGGELVVYDRGWAAGDELLLREWEPKYCRYTGLERRMRILSAELVDKWNYRFVAVAVARVA